MPSSNPAFSRGFPAAGSQSGGWGAGPQQTYGGVPTQHDPYSAPSPYAATGRAYMTMDDVVAKTGISLVHPTRRVQRQVGPASSRCPGTTRTGVPPAGPTVGSQLCPRSGSNRHWNPFKGPASADWATGASGSPGRRTLAPR